MSIQPHFEQAATAQFVIEPAEDRFLATNHEAALLARLDRDALLRTRPSALFAPSFAGLISFTQELLDRGRGWSDQLVMQVGDSAEQVEVTGRSETADASQALYLSVQKATDIDAQRSRADARRHHLSGLNHWQRMARVFQEFERKNQLLLEAAGEGIYGVDANGLTTFVNPAAERILGYRAEELAGRNMHTLVHHTHANGEHYHIQECPIFAAFRDGTVQQVDDEVFWTKSGKPIEVEYTSTPVQEDGAIVGTVVVFRDVSQKKSDHRKLAAALAEVEQLKNRLELENAYLQEEISSEFNHHQIIGKSLAVQSIIQKIHLVAPTETTVLISGESGTGKELIARAIHDTSDRSARSLIRVNCAAIPEDLFESEFFGHAKGAFTGATADRPGRFELADGGTLFLDEVGEIPLHLQSKLLRVLQEQQFERVGEARTRDVDVRIVAATNRDLKVQVAEGQFREDLYFRLNVFPIESVPLRERKEDIPMLTQHLLERVSVRARKTGLKIPLSEMDKLMAYHWPGNVRELENVIERQVILARSETIRFEALLVAPTSTETQLVQQPRKGLLSDREIKAIDRENLKAALRASGGKVFGEGGAAQLLEMKPTTMASRLKKYAIAPVDYRPGATGPG